MKGHCDGDHDDDDDDDDDDDEDPEEFTHKGTEYVAFPPVPPAEHKES